MKTPNKIVLDLDAIVPENDVVLKLDKKEHPLVPVTVNNFVKNMKTMEKLGTGAMDTETEKGIIIEMLNQVFPSVGVARFGELTMKQLDQLLSFARANSGEEQVATEAAQADPQTAAAE
jgi:membrane-bound lytic murein transglycosylase MltF